MKVARQAAGRVKRPHDGDRDRGSRNSDPATARSPEVAKGLVIVLAAAFVLIGTSMLPDELWGLRRDAAAALTVLVFSVVLWISQAIPLSVTALIAVGLLVATGVVSDFSDAAAGFAMDTVFFLIAVNLLSRAVVDSGLMARLAQAVARVTNGSAKRTVWALAGTSALTAFVMPSALARAKAFLPIAEQVDADVRSNETPSRFLRASSMVIGVLGPAATLLVITGGGLAIVAARTIAQFAEPINYVQWLLMMAPPSLLVIGLTTFSIVRLFPPEEGRGEVKKVDERERQPAPALSRQEWMVLGALFVALSLWLAGTSWDIPLALPAILSAALLALPGVNLVTTDSVDRQRWDEIMTVGAALSLSAALSQTGAIEWLATRAFAVFPDHPSSILVYLLVMVVCAGLRQLFLMPSPCIAITLPIVIEVGRVTGVDPIFLALVSTGVIGVTQVVPVQSPPSLVAFTRGAYTVSDELRAVPFLLGSITIAYLLAGLVYWPFLRLIGWV